MPKINVWDRGERCCAFNPSHTLKGFSWRFLFFTMLHVLKNILVLNRFYTLNVSIVMRTDIDIIHFFQAINWSERSSVYGVFLDKTVIHVYWQVSECHYISTQILKAQSAPDSSLVFWNSNETLCSCVLRYRNKVNGFQMYLGLVGRASVSEVHMWSQSFFWMQRMSHVTCQETRHTDHTQCSLHLVFSYSSVHLDYL